MRRVVEWNLFWWDCADDALVSLLLLAFCFLGRGLSGLYLEIAQLGEFLAAVVEETGEGFCLEVGDLVGADVAALGEALVADVAFEGFFAGVSALMGLGWVC